MSATELETARGEASVVKVQMDLEVQIVPVADVDRAKEFYEHLGWRFDGDVAPWTASASSSSRLRAPVPR